MLRGLWNKVKHHQAAKFIFVGILNTIIGYGVFGLFIYLNLHYSLALALATVIGVIHSYAWNKYYTFQSKNKSLKEFLRFVSVYAVIFVMNLGLLWILVDNLHVHPLIAQGVALFLVTLTSFAGHKFWSFRGH